MATRAHRYSSELLCMLMAKSCRAYGAMGCTVPTRTHGQPSGQQTKSILLQLQVLALRDTSQRYFLIDMSIHRSCMTRPGWPCYLRWPLSQLHFRDIYTNIYSPLREATCTCPAVRRRTGLECMGTRRPVRMYRTADHVRTGTTWTRARPHAVDAVHQR